MLAYQPIGVYGIKDPLLAVAAGLWKHLLAEDDCRFDPPTGPATLLDDPRRGQLKHERRPDGCSHYPPAALMSPPVSRRSRSRPLIVVATRSG